MIEQEVEPDAPAANTPVPQQRTGQEDDSGAAHEVRRLAAALRMPLGLPVLDDQRDVRIDTPMIKFAARRHRIAGLLHPWLKLSGPGQISPEVAHALQRARERNRMRSLRLDWNARDINALCGREVPSLLLFKGSSLARQLYADHLLSRSNDIDVLVDGRDFKVTAERLLTAGFVAQDLSRRHKPTRIDWAYYSIGRDIALRHRSSQTMVELHHRRLMVDRLPPFTVERSDDGADLPYAVLDSAYATYFIAHGAQTRWHRLKWLADLTQVWRRLTEAQLIEMIRQCEDAAIATAARASLVLAEDIFPLSTPAVLLEWARAAHRRAEVEGLHVRYRRTLFDPAVSLRQRFWEVYRGNPYGAVAPRVEALARVAAIAALRRLRRIA